MEQAYVLHSIPYKETSLVIELFTKGQGRVPVVAKGAKRKSSALRSVLVSFQPLWVRFSGKGEVKTLIQAEWAGGVLAPEGQGLFAAYYLNELLMKGLKREDSHEALFDAYASALSALSQNVHLQVAVRFFELQLLRELGFGVDFGSDTLGNPITPDLRYAWVNESGWIESSRARHSDLPLICELDGMELQHLQNGEISLSVAQACKPLTRYLLGRHIAPDGILSRTWMEQLVRP